MLRYAARQASGFRVVQITGVEAEMELPFAGVHQLFNALPDRLDALPPPQHEALSVTLGIEVGAPPDRFLLGLALLGLLSAVAEERPLLCLVDDAQWLDTASAQALGFVGRRIRGESVAILAAQRVPVVSHDFDGLAELHLEGLPDDVAHQLLRSSVTGRLEDHIADRIVAETHGNPLALLELPATMTAAELAGGFGLPHAAALPSHMEGHYLRRIRALPEPTQRLMLVAAAEPFGDPALVLRAAGRLDIDTSALGPAETADLFEIGTSARFRHPLVRSAVYRSAAPGSRQQVHKVLAEVSTSDEDADRHAWHRALAATGPDEDVAAELEAAAGRAQARGGVAATAAFLQRATDLTPDPARQGGRALAAAGASIQAGEFETASRLLATAWAGPLDDLGRAHIDLLNAQLAFISSRGTDATPLLLAAARRLESLDISMARETYVDAFSAALFGARLNGDVGLVEVAAAAREAPQPPVDNPAPADLLLDALVARTDDFTSAVPLCRTAVEQLAAAEASPRDRLRWLWQGCVIALEIWDDTHASTLSHSSVEVARTTGTLSELALALSARTPVLVFCGDLAAAAATVSETASVEQVTGIRSAPYGALLVSAWRGRENETAELIEVTEREAGARGEGIGLAICAYARAVVCNGLARYEDALAAAVSASEHREIVAENWGLTELVEAATRCGRTDLAADAVKRLTVKADAAQTDWAIGIAARGQALIAEPDEADQWYRASIDHLARTQVRAELARSQLLYGEWLRRHGHRRDARDQLTKAHDLFTSMGMDAFAQRTDNELVGTGEKRRTSAAQTQDDLTPQERQIADLAREGLSNPQIGARLFLSPRTVEWHLRHVYTKLGIRSRRELGAALAGSLESRGRDAGAPGT